MQKDYQYIIDKAQTLTLYLVAVSLPWPIRFGAWALALFILISLLNYKQIIQYHFSYVPFLISCILFFLFHWFWFLSDSASANAWFEVEKKASFLFLPFILLNNTFKINAERSINLMRYYTFSMMAASVVCLACAAYSYATDHQGGIFYYHQLADIINHHAVYFSAQIILAIVFSYYFIIKKTEMLFHSILIFFFVMMLLFLSSKIMIICFCLLLFIVFMKNLIAHRISKKVLTAVLITGVIIVSVSVSNEFISKRFTDLSLERAELIYQEKYNQSVYFDGLTLRLIQLKFANRILNENHAWLSGVGPVKSQELLNNKYKMADMYSGIDEKSGYMGYNFHNQYAETLVRFGLPGLILILTMIIYIFVNSICTRNFLLFIFCFLFSVFFFSESVLETQRGVVTFLFFACFLLKFNSKDLSVN